MAAPEFTVDEIKFLINAKKVVPYDEWQGQKETRHGKESQQFNCHLAEKSDEWSCLIEISPIDAADAISITFYAIRFRRRAARPLCRYDIHDGRHLNRHRWHPPRYIEVRQPHRHVYNPRAVREGTVSDWHVCADPLDLRSGGSLRQQIDRLKKKFLSDLNIEILNSDAALLF